MNEKECSKSNTGARSSRSEFPRDFEKNRANKKAKGMQHKNPWPFFSFPFSSSAFSTESPITPFFYSSHFLAHPNLGHPSPAEPIAPLSFVTGCLVCLWQRSSCPNLSQVFLFLYFHFVTLFYPSYTLTRTLTLTLTHRHTHAQTICLRASYRIKKIIYTYSS